MENIDTKALLAELGQLKSAKVKLEAENKKLTSERGDHIKRQAVATETGRLNLPPAKARIVEQLLLSETQVEFVNGKPVVQTYEDGLPRIDAKGRPIGLE